MERVTKHTILDNSKKSEYIKILLPFMYFTFLLLVIFRDFSIINVNKYIFVFIGLIICSLSNANGILAFIALITPLHGGLSSTLITSIAFLFYLIKRSKNKIKYTSLVCFFIITIIEVFSSIYGHFDIFNFIRFIFYFAFMIIVLSDDSSNYNGKVIINCFIIGFIVAVICLIGQLLSKFSLNQILSLETRLGDTVALTGVKTQNDHVFFNSNDLGVLCSITCLLSLIMLKNKKNPFYFVPIFLSAIICIMTMSKTGIITYLVAILLFFIFSGDNIYKHIRNIVLGTIFLIFVIYLVYNLIPSSFDGLINRFKADDISSGRNDIIIAYFQNMIDNPFRYILGVGLNEYNLIVKAIFMYGTFLSCHNAIQEILVTWGIVGFITTCCLFAFFIKTWKNKYKPVLFIQWCPLLIIFLGLQAGQGFSQWNHMHYIIVCFMALTLNINKKEHGIG